MYNRYNFVHEFNVVATEYVGRFLESKFIFDFVCLSINKLRDGPCVGTVVFAA